MTVSRIRLAVLALALVLVDSVQAQSWLLVSGVSWHNQAGYNGLNPGLGVEVQVSPGRTVAGGIYYNSEYKTSVYGLAKYQIWQQGAWQMQINGGLVSGYAREPVLPVILPEVCWHWLCGVAAPAVGGSTTAFAALYLRVPIQNY